MSTEIIVVIVVAVIVVGVIAFGMMAVFRRRRLTSSASPRIKDPNRRSPPGARASSSMHLTQRKWQNDHAK
jgi:hypothetical protein